MALMLEAGKGWAVSKESCRPDATFSAQAEPLVEIRTLERYTELDLIKAERCRSATQETDRTREVLFAHFKQ
jgi:hypothetical protein